MTVLQVFCKNTDHVMRLSIVSPAPGYPGTTGEFTHCKLTSHRRLPRRLPRRAGHLRRETPTNSRPPYHRRTFQSWTKSRPPYHGGLFQIADEVTAPIPRKNLSNRGRSPGPHTTGELLETGESFNQVLISNENCYAL